MHQKESCLFTFRAKQKLALTPFVVDVTKHTLAFLAYARLFSACLVAGPAKGSHELMVSPGYSTPPRRALLPTEPCWILWHFKGKSEVLQTAWRGFLGF